jgi:hypothetical protein
MPSFTLKNIPQDLYELLKRSADANRRSINSELLVCVERALGVRPADADELLAQARAVRPAVGDAPLTAAEVTAAKRQGRP